MIYSWFWGILPGNRWVKIALSTLILIGATAGLFLWVFPALDQLLTPPPVVE